MIHLRVLGLLAITVSLRAMALEPAQCEAAAQSIDERLAAPGLPDQSIALVTQMRAALIQSCPFLDESSLQNMLKGIDQMLPAAANATPVPQPSQAERQAEREAQRAEADRRQRERAGRRAARDARKSAERELISPVLMQAPRGTSVGGQLVARPDPMSGARLLDWDIYEERVRILYETSPFPQQMGQADAAYHLYVVELDGKDNVVQHHVLEYELARRLTVGLFPGRDELIFQWHATPRTDVAATPSTLERWSISNATRLSESPAPAYRISNLRVGAAQGTFRLITDSGQLLYATTVALGSGPNPETGVAWMLTSAAGDVSRQGLIAHKGESVSTDFAFPTNTGGAGLVLNIRGTTEAGIRSSLKPDLLRIGSAELRPVVGSERRIYLVGGPDSGVALPAFQRRFIWLGVEELDQALLLSGEGSRLMDEAEGRYRIRDSSVGLASSVKDRLSMATPGSRYAILVRNSYTDDAFPPTRGLWLQEFAAGQPRRDTYLEPDQAYLKTVFTMLASDGGSGLYVASDSRILHLGADRKVQAFAQSGATVATINAMIAAGKSAWLFGIDKRADPRRLWVERAVF